MENATVSFEFDFTQQDFEGLAKLVTTQTGIELPESKKSLMYSRLVRRVRHHKMANFAEYLNFVQKELDTGKNEEMLAIVNAMTTNVTHFFREQHHFDHLEKMLPTLIEKHGKVNIWCSASSIGAEPWSIAMVVHKFKQTNPTANITITASDIDSNALNTAKEGVYELQESDVKNHPLLKKYMKKSTKPLSSRGEMEKATAYEVDSCLKPLIHFQQLNLMHQFPMTIPSHCAIIFCRNVIIYFGKETKRDLFARMKQLQKEGDFLYIGHSESLIDICDAYTPLGKTIYERNNA